MSNETIKALLYTDPTAFQIFGGAEIQMIETKTHLESISKNITLKFFNAFEDKLDDYKLFHVFQMRTECLSICKLAKSRGLKILLSSIYWPEYEKRRISTIGNVLSRFQNLYLNFKDYKYFTSRNLHPYKDFLDLADIVMPTSKTEANLLSKEFNIKFEKFFPVPVGVDSFFSNANSDLFVRKYGLKDFVLFLGRIESTKNVLTLLKAWKDIKIPLVIIGHFNLWEREYFVECKKLMGQNPNVHYLGFLPRNSPELISAYAAAKVFVLPSWHEVTSLTALEAGLAGCNVVITKNSYSKEYLQDFASYVDPASALDIKKKILEAYEKSKSSELKEHILKNYTWQNTAKKTAEAYKLTLPRK